MTKLKTSELIKALRVKLDKTELLLKEARYKIKLLEAQVTRLKEFHYRIEDFDEDDNLIS